jgi:pimeloyl-ACP methyl ester carboxylesterase
MLTEELHFFSDGLRLSGSLFLPDPTVRLGDAEGAPIIVICAGFTGRRDWLPAIFATALTELGHRCFSFDFRGEGTSEGPRHRVILEEQARDIRHAVTYLLSEGTLGAERVVVLGWGMSAGTVIDATRQLPGVAGIGAFNGFYSGRRFLANRSSEEFMGLVRLAQADRVARTRGDRPLRAAPYDLYPLDATSDAHMATVRHGLEGSDDDDYSVELLDSLLRWEPHAYAPLSDLPLLIAHSSHNELHPISEAEDLVRLHGGPTQLCRLERVGHTEWVRDGDPTLVSLCRSVDRWLKGT